MIKQTKFFRPKKHEANSASENNRYGEFFLIVGLIFSIAMMHKFIVLNNPKYVIGALHKVNSLQSETTTSVNS